MIINESLGIWYLFNPPTVILSLTLINYKNICHSGRFPPFNPWVPDVTGMIKTNGFMFQVSNFYGHLAILTHLNLGVKFLMKIKIWANMCAVCYALTFQINILSNKCSEAWWLSQTNTRNNSFLHWDVSLIFRSSECISCNCHFADWLTQQNW